MEEESFIWRDQLILVKITLSNIPIHYLTALPLLVKVARKLERIQCRFLWGNDDERRRYHLVNWKDVKKLIRVGVWALDLW